MSWLDQESEGSRARRQFSEVEVARHLRWMCCSGVLTLSVAVTAAATASAKNFFYFVIPFVVSCFFTGRQWVEWRRAKRWLAAAPEDDPESSREAVEDVTSVSRSATQSSRISAAAKSKSSRLLKNCSPRVSSRAQRGICFVCALKVKQIPRSPKTGATSG